MLLKHIIITVTQVFVVIFLTINFVLAPGSGDESEDPQNTKSIGEIPSTSNEQEADLASKLTDAKDKLVILDFTAKWCAPCKLLDPFIKKLAKEFSDVMILKKDVEECIEEAIEYNILSLPTFVFIKSKKEVFRYSGANEDELKEHLIKHRL